MRRAVQLRNQPWHRLLCGLVLPLLLMLAQSGAVFHELSHYAGSQTHESQKQFPGSDVCDLCLAYAQVGSAAVPEAAVLPLLADLTHLQTPVLPAVTLAIELPAERNRGPPHFL